MKSFKNLFIFPFLFSSLKCFALARVKTTKQSIKLIRQKLTKNYCDPYLNGKTIKQFMNKIFASLLYMHTQKVKTLCLPSTGVQLSLFHLSIT